MQVKFRWGTILLTLPTQALCVPDILQLRKPEKVAEFFNSRFLKKDWPSLWKVLPFVGDRFSRKKNYPSHLKVYTKKLMLFIYQMVLRMLGLDGWATSFVITEISRCFETLCRVRGSIRQIYISSLVSLNRYTFYLVPCWIWIRVIYLRFEKQGNSEQKFQLDILKVSKNVMFSNDQRPLNFTPRPFQTLMCQDWAHRRMSEFPKRTEAFSKE